MPDFPTPEIFKKRKTEDAKPGGVYRSDIFMSDDEKRRRDAARRNADTEAEIRAQSRAASEQRPNPFRDLPNTDHTKEWGGLGGLVGGLGGGTPTHRRVTIEESHAPSTHDSDVLADKYDQKKRLGY